MKIYELFYNILVSTCAAIAFGMWQSSISAGFFMFSFLIPIFCTLLSIERNLRKP